MDPSVTAGAPATTGDVHFLNLEYFFYLLYSLQHGVNGGNGFSYAWLFSLLTTVWIVTTIVAYVISAAAIALMVYAHIRKHQVLALEHDAFSTFPNEDSAESETEHHRWKHVRELIESSNENDWRQAIIEADIILDDMLTRLGYIGNSIGDKLKAANPIHFRTLQEAWEAHKVRNDIAHQGSSYQLTNHVAYRTILQYENVFREHNEI